MVNYQTWAPSLKRRLQKLLGPLQLTWIQSSELHPRLGDLAGIENAIFEMAVRARSAMPFGGSLVIESAHVDLDETAAQSQGLRSGRYVMFEMTCLRQDTSDLILSGARAPLFGVPDTWLHSDLTQVQAMICSLGGQICEYNEPGQALTIRAFFPSAPNASSSFEDASVNEELKQFRILLVEDEGYVRDVAREILESEGYHVLAARTGKEALEIFERSGPVQLLLTDVVMPGMNGHDLSDELTTRHPELKTIYMSGYTDGFGPQTHRHDVRLAFIQKPFTLESLTAKVKQVLSPATM